ncbi:tRNA1(Val) (adenine(37)-N6)-methyltransferase [Chitinophaga niabensis]|uniref:tRNA1(Val) (adenine(37)-N6)-methyltransferase n=1 Tax=Chitinophaga niabensis TaxID=536979 RepID=A0A1N6EJX3_9BACT|nr:methyltransferase [Chitinophaga niabensis]SIN83260.1 tRNA1Val (adenine37-N6)-methyltransferase [Chitinophaga niabensis]
MANTFFEFKQFTVHQDKTAMKVCTDACIQGAFTASRMPAVPRVLDIGTGTGLLSLMLAQQSSAAIDAIELDEQAALQAAANFEASPWGDRLHVIREDVRAFSGEHYPFIISNPPFYEQDLKSPSHQRNAAMHAVSLGYEELLAAIKRLLSKDGSFSVLLPYDGFQRFNALAVSGGFVLRELLLVRQTPAHDYFRAVGIFGPAGTLNTTEISIYDAQRNYTPEFSALLQQYYLYL